MLRKVLVLWSEIQTGHRAVVSCYATNLRTTMYIYQLHPHITLYKVDSYFTVRSVQQLLPLLDFLTCLNLTFS